MAEGLQLHLCIRQYSTCSDGLLLPGDLAFLQVTAWSEVGGPCVRGSSECFPVTGVNAVAASLRRAGRPLSFKLAVQDTWGHANEKGLPLLGFVPCSQRVDIPFQAPDVPVGGVFKFASHSATRLQLPGHYRQGPMAASIAVVLKLSPLDCTVRTGTAAQASLRSMQG